MGGYLKFDLGFSFFILINLKVFVVYVGLWLRTSLTDKPQSLDLLNADSPHANQFWILSYNLLLLFRLKCNLMLCVLLWQYWNNTWLKKVIHYTLKTRGKTFRSMILILFLNYIPYFKWEKVTLKQLGLKSYNFWKRQTKFSQIQEAYSS